MSSRFWSNTYLTFNVTAPGGVCEQYVLRQPFATLGSKSDCDVVIDDAQVKPRSLFVWQTSSGMQAIVLAAKSRRLGRVFRVEPDHPISVRKWTVSISTTSADEGKTIEAEEPSSLRNGSEPDSIHCLTWKSKIGRQYLQLPNERMFVVGRKKPANLILDDDRLSSAHCGVMRVGQELWAVDLGSSNGTWSRSERHRVHEIKIDKSICVGSQRLHFTRLITEHGQHTVTGKLDSLQQVADELRSNLTAAHNDATQQRTALLASLRLAEQHSEELKLDHEEKVVRQERLIAVYQKEIAEQQNECLEMQRARAELQSELDATRETVQKNEESLQQLIEANTALQQHQQMLQNQHDELMQQKSEAESELANRDMEVSLREKELDRLAVEVAEQRSETEQLQAKLVMERRVLETLEMELGKHDAVESPADSVADDHLVASPEFHSMLDEALDALPRLDDS